MDLENDLYLLQNITDMNYFSLLQLTSTNFLSWLTFCGLYPDVNNKICPKCNIWMYLRTKRKTDGTTIHRSFSTMKTNAYKLFYCLLNFVLAFCQCK